MMHCQNALEKSTIIISICDPAS